MSLKLKAFLLGAFLIPSFSACKSSNNSDDSTLALLALMYLNSSGGCYAGATAATTTSSSAQYTVVDTNQTTCYDASGATVACNSSNYSYDAQFPGNAPSYTATSSTVVTDNNTGLMWTQSSDLNGDGVVNYSDKKYQNDAVTYCENLELGGYSDWRLPDVKTLYSLIEFSGKDASVVDQTSYNTSLLTLFIDTSYFDKAFGDTSAGDRIIDAQYATSTNYVYTTMHGDTTMFGLNFVDGRIKGYPCGSKKFYVRCVRGNTSYGLNNFTDNGNGTVTDSATGLMWQKNDASSTSWQNAVDTCTAATTGAQTDWRLPDAKELQSIMDYSRSADTSSSAALHSIFSATSFINENGATDYAYYWSSTTHLDDNDDATNAVYLSFGRADGYFCEGPSCSYLDVHGAGAQRSNDKASESADGASSANLGYGSFYYHGPQGDIVRTDNKVRCVRN